MLEPTWNNQIAEARKLPDAELQRHASVSTNNGCACGTCFCCACVAVLAERKPAKITRADYMEKRATFEEYYRNVNAAAGLRVTNRDLIERVRAAIANGDEHLNTIPLSTWDALGLRCKAAVSRALKERGDFWSIAGGVCSYKQAARDAAFPPPAP